jgi:4-carboxymuconolactone decarboxylase
MRLPELGAGLCERAEALGPGDRPGSALRPRLRELIALIAARHWGARHCWDAHTGPGISAGLDFSMLKVLDRGQRPRFCEADEEIIYRLATELLDRHLLTDDTFAAALDRFGAQGVADAVGALGSFSMAAMVVTAFQIGPASGAPLSSGPGRRRW